MTAIVNAATERCGACGTVVPAGSELCPACGALLDAYRTPPTVDPLPEASTAEVPQPNIIKMPAEGAVAIGTAAGVDPMLLDARRRLVRTLAAPSRELIDVVERREAEQPTTVAVEPPQPERAREPEIRQPIPRPSSVRPASNARRVNLTPPPSPKRPGYVVRGTVEPIILVGVALFLIACFVAAVGSLLGSSAWQGVGLSIAAIGVIAVIGAILVALVRRDSERG